ncbi:beta-lactamase family protein [bacterium]|nr:beta-lactamase family protein [bacterium]
MNAETRAGIKNNTGLKREQKVSLDRELTSMIGDNGTKVPGLGVIVFRDGKEVYSKFLGSSRIDNEDRSKDRPFTRESRFRAASVSKPFTAFTIMQLKEQGKIDLDEDISKYLGFTLRNPHYPDIPITVRMLASHTSSIRDGQIYGIPPSMSVEEFFKPEGEWYEGGAHFAPQGEKPGEYFSYCNLNYGLLGTIIESVTGERFDLYQKGHILKQLSIGGDYVAGNFSPQEFEKLGTVYQKKDAEGKWDENGPWYGQADDYRGRQPQADIVAPQNPYAEGIQEDYILKGYRPGTNATMLSPAGGLRLSVEELSHALLMLINGGVYEGKRVLSPASIQEMASRQWTYTEKTNNGENYGGSILSYGLGLYQIDGKSTARFCRDKEFNFIGHTGEAFGLLSSCFFRPGTGDGFVYIINGTALEVDKDERSLGKFSSNYIWEEKLTDAICRSCFIR